MGQVATSLLFVVATLPATCIAADSLPVSPLRPTYGDCGLLSARFYRDHLRPALDQLSQCLRQKPEFGMGSKCDGRSTLKAWAQCDAYDKSLCAISEARDRELGVCQARARATLSEAERKRRDVVDAARQVEAARRQAGDLYGRALEAHRFVNDPVVYLKSKLVQGFPDAVSRLFRGTQAYELSNFDADLGSRMYKLAHQYANHGAATTPDPLVGAIQQQALTHLNSEFGKTLLALDQFSLAMHDFNPAAWSPARPPLPRAVSDSKADYKAMMGQANDELALADRQLRQLTESRSRLGREIESLAEQRLREQRLRDELTDRLNRLESERRNGNQLSLETLNQEIERLRNERAHRQQAIDRLIAEEDARRREAQELRMEEEQGSQQRYDALEALGTALGSALQTYNGRATGGVPRAGVPAGPGAAPRHPCYDYSTNPPRPNGRAGCPGSSGNAAPGAKPPRVRDDTAPSR